MTGHAVAAVFPDIGALTGGGALEEVAGALLTFTLIISVLMMLICVIGWAIASSTGNYAAAAKARTGVLVAAGAAVMAGAAAAWMNWLISVGSTL